ncbi:MAG: hypothetical protein K2Q09_05370 [Phycisphaerales bacterium]|nr:hypothetical protein [Phycisphaerales bacterium]
MSDAGCTNNPWRDEDVAFLASIGYKAADVPFERKDMSDDPEFANVFLSTASAMALQSAAAAPPVIPGRGPVVPGQPAWPAIPMTLPGGTPATPMMLPCPGPGISMWVTLRGAWTPWSCASTWKSLPSTPALGLCNYEKDCCRYRAVWTATVAPSCVVTYAFVGSESECWTHTIACTSATDSSGAAYCPNPISTQNQNCGTGLTPVSTPPGGTPTHPHP